MSGNEQEESAALHLRSVLEYAERETCTHEETHRGGSIWEICDSCGAKWADDEGGKPADAHDLPKVLTEAREFLASEVTPPSLTTPGPWEGELSEIQKMEKEIQEMEGEIQELEREIQKLEKEIYGFD